MGYPLMPKWLKGTPSNISSQMHPNAWWVLDTYARNRVPAADGAGHYWTEVFKEAGWIVFSKRLGVYFITPLGRKFHELGPYEVTMRQMLEQFPIKRDVINTYAWMVPYDLAQRTQQGKIAFRVKKNFNALRDYMENMPDEWDIL